MSTSEPAPPKSAVANQRVPGHGLQHEGRPVLAQACCAMNATTHGQRNYYDKHGHGICSCGAMSPHEDTHAARQQWHREHKASLTGGSAPLADRQPTPTAQSAAADT